MNNGKKWKEDTCFKTYMFLHNTACMYSMHVLVSVYNGMKLKVWARGKITKDIFLCVWLFTYLYSNWGWEFPDIPQFDRLIFGVRYEEPSISLKNSEDDHYSLFHFPCNSKHFVGKYNTYVQWKRISFIITVKYSYNASFHNSFSLFRTMYRTKLQHLIWIKYILLSKLHKK